MLLYEFETDLNAFLARLPLFDQELLRQADAKSGLQEAAYHDARETCLNAVRAGGCSTPAAVAGYPHITVQAG